jgi:hypothetical protein
MLRSMVAGTTSAAVLGMTFAVVSSILFGTAALPFIVGSSLGFAIGSTRWYMASIDEAMLALDAYPALLRLHLLTNYPRVREFRTRDVEWFTHRNFDGRWARKSMLVASWLTAQPALDDIHAREELVVVEAYSNESKGQDTEEVERIRPE